MVECFNLQTGFVAPTHIAPIKMITQRIDGYFKNPSVQTMKPTTKYTQNYNLASHTKYCKKKEKKTEKR